MGKQISDRTRRILSISFIVLFALSLGTALVSAQPVAKKIPGCEYGPDTCKQGFVWREARPSDHVCVIPSVRDQTRTDNSLAVSRRQPGGGAYGPLTCKSGYVWRDAWDGDGVCVTPETRTQAKLDNSLAESRKSCKITTTPEKPVIVK
jgi:hypothetical protein